MYPSGFQGYSQDVIFGHYEQFANANDGPTVLITLYDVWVNDNPRLAEIPVIASWVPVDTFPPNPKVVDWCSKPNVLPIAMSRNGQAMLKTRGVEALYVPHSVDTNVFTPDAKLEGGRDAREMLGVGDRFVVTMVSTNKGAVPVDRKAYPEQIMAFAEFARDKKDDVVLFIHADQYGMHNGINLTNVCEDVGLEREQVVFTDQYRYRTGGLPAAVMAAIYASSDVLLMASRGEGFGIPAVEAQACGTPVILSDATAQTELCGDGWLVGGQPFYHPGQRAMWQTPSIGGVVGSLEAAYERGVGQSSAEARTFAEQYDHDRVFADHWEPALQALEARTLRAVVEAKTPNKKKKGKKKKGKK